VEGGARIRPAPARQRRFRPHRPHRLLAFGGPAAGDGPAVRIDADGEDPPIRIYDLKPSFAEQLGEASRWIALALALLAALAAGAFGFFGPRPKPAPGGDR
jgi:hypothetical protein